MGGSKTRAVRTADCHALRALLVRAARYRGPANQMFKLVGCCVIKHELLISKIDVSCFSLVSITTVLNDDTCRFVLFSTCVRATTRTGCLLGTCLESGPTSFSSIFRLYVYNNRTHCLGTLLIRTLCTNVHLYCV